MPVSRLTATLAALTAVLASPGAIARADMAAPPSTNLTLAQVVAMAKARAPAVHAAFARIASAEAGVDHARAAELPSLYAQGSGTGFGSNGHVYAGGVASVTDTEAYFLGQGTLNLQWTLYDFGHTSAAVDSAKAGVNAATLSARATEQVAMSEAAVAFFTLLADDDLVRSAEASRVDREHVLSITHHLVEAGFRPPVDETRAQIALDVAKLAASVAMATRDSDSVNLATALLLDPSTTFHLSPPSPLRVDDGGNQVGEIAVKTRRDVAAAAAKVDQARLNVTSAKRAHLPSVSATASGGVVYSYDVATGPDPTDKNYPNSKNTIVYPPVSGPTETGTGTLILSIPIIDSLINANVRAAEANLGEAQAGLEQVTQSARSEALQASRAAKNARVVLDQSQRLAAGAAANLSVVEERYSGGMESPLALADAQREDAAARVAIVKAQLAYEIAAVRLLAGLSRADELLRTR
jgi:outer membrane protein TolC